MSRLRMSKRKRTADEDDRKKTPWKKQMCLNFLNGMEDEENGLEPEPEALETSLILNKVFTFLDHYNDRKNFCLVNQTWNKVGAPLTVQLRLYINTWSVDARNVDIILHRRNGFQSDRIKFNSMKDLEDQLRSWHTKRIAIHFTSNTVNRFLYGEGASFVISYKDLLNLIGKFSPWIHYAMIESNLDILTNEVLYLSSKLEYIYIKTWKGHTNSYVFPSVKRIRFNRIINCTSPVVDGTIKFPINFQNILTTFPNVVEILDFPMYHITQAKDCPQLCRKIKSTSDLHPANIDLKTNLVLLPLLCPPLQLTSLTISSLIGNGFFLSNWADCCTMFSKILASSQDTLQELHLEPLPPHLYVAFPVLRALKTISFRNTENLVNIDSRYFPINFKVNKVFPNVVNVNFVGSPHLDNEPYKLLPLDFSPKGNAFQKIQLLKLQDSRQQFPTSILNKIWRVLPPLVSLDIGDNVSWLAALPNIWTHCSSLKFLTIVIDVSSGEILGPNLDHIFTGIPQNLLETLKSHDEKVALKLEYQRKPSISSLSNLQRLDIIFKGARLFWQDGQYFSRLTGLFGFKLLPKLHVFIGIEGVSPASTKENVTQKVQPILPFVTLDPNYVYI